MIKAVQLTKSIFSDRLDLLILTGMASLVTIAGLAGTLVEISRLLSDEPTALLELNDVEVKPATDDVEIAYIEVWGEVATTRTVFAFYQLGAIIQSIAFTSVAASITLISWSARQGDPFGQSSFRKVLFAGCMMLVGFLGAVVQFCAEFTASAELGTPEGTLSFGWAVGAVLVMALAKVWSYGVDLNSETELTI